MLQIQQIETAWNPVSSFLFVPHDEAGYKTLVGLLDELIDEVGEDETHQLSSLMELVGTLIEKYEDEHVPEFTA